MSTDNPFAPPTATLEDPSLESLELAKRSTRFWAAFIDGMIFLPLLWPLFFAIGMFDGFPNIQPLSPPKTIILNVAGIALYLGLHGYLLATRGQTIGKWLLGIRIVRTDGTPIEFGRLVGLRYLPFWAVSLVPLVGYVVSIVDVLFIFSESRRCLHDRIAETIVVRA